MNAPPTIFTSGLRYSPYWKPHPSFTPKGPLTICTSNPTHHFHLKPHPPLLL